MTVDPIFGCHLANGRLDRDGYAFHGKTRAHIAAWVAVYGPVPEGFEIEHRCRRRNCTRHLELVTRSENELRKSWKFRSRLPLCAKGHDKSNAMVTPEGGRICRICDR